MLWKQSGPVAECSGVLDMMGLTAKLRQKSGLLQRLEVSLKKVRETPCECAVGYPVGATGLGTPEAAYDGKASIIQVAIWNNYGTENIPARPFMDLAARNMRDLYKSQMKKFSKPLMRGEAKLEKVLDVIGLMAEEEVRKAIMDGDWAENSAATVRAKKSDRPLVDTGTLKNRVTHKVRTKGKAGA